jgi:multidrug efflux pump
MALTISTGFVVDDAIVMIENIARYVGGGAAAAGGAQGRGSDWLHDRIADRVAHRRADSAAVHARCRRRLFREFAITLSVTILVSAVVSLTLTPMMCARDATAHAARTRRALARALEDGFTRRVTPMADR